MICTESAMVIIFVIICIVVFFQIAECQPLIGNRDDFSNMDQEYADDKIYQAKVQVSYHWLVILCNCKARQCQS